MRSWQGVVFLVSADFEHDLITVETFLHVDPEDDEVEDLSFLNSLDVFRECIIAVCAEY